MGWELSGLYCYCDVTAQLAFILVVVWLCLFNNRLPASTKQERKTHKLENPGSKLVIWYDHEPVVVLRSDSPCFVRLTYTNIPLIQASRPLSIYYYHLLRGMKIRFFVLQKFAQARGSRE